jgi:hypothetical protein
MVSYVFVEYSYIEIPFLLIHLGDYIPQFSPSLGMGKWSSVEEPAPQIIMLGGRRLLKNISKHCSERVTHN